jgi:allantoinase
MTNNNAEFGLYSKRILSEKGLVEGTILIKNGIISKLIEGKFSEQGIEIKDFNVLVIQAGIIDCHVHINEPGRTEWEGFETMTKAALAGGITTLVDMPLNASPVTTSKNAFEIKLKATEGKLYCNCAFWGGIVPKNIDFLDELIAEGVFGIKAFLTHSGIDDFPNVTLEDLKKGLPILKKYNVPLLVHAELDEMHDDLLAFEKNPTSYQAYLKSRPKIWEDNAIDLAISLCEEFDTPVHIVHLSSANKIDKIKKARAKGLKLTVETCPQYLFFNAEDIPDAQTIFKCAPPIREKGNNDKLWAALKDGTIDFIVTDHSPATPNLKEIESGNLKKAWGGIASIQFSLPIIWTEAQKRGFSIEEIGKLVSSNIASFLKLENSKGTIAEGMDADLVIWNPEEEFVVREEEIHYKHKISPYMNQKLKGKIKETFIAGKKVFENGNFVSLPIGKIILRK